MHCTQIGFLVVALFNAIRKHQKDMEAAAALKEKAKRKAAGTCVSALADILLKFAL